MENHNCNDPHCDCNENHQDLEELETMTLILEDDRELECYVLGVFACNSKDYIALLPTEEEDVLLYRYQEEGEEVILENIEEDDEYDEVSEAFVQLMNEETPEDKN